VNTMKSPITTKTQITSTDSNGWIRSREDISRSPGLKVTKLNLSVEALESLNAHVPGLSAVLEK
jgi:hypothetical protein